MYDEEELLSYLYSQAGVDKLFKLFRKEIINKRGIQGFIRLHTFSDEELEFLSDFFDVSVKSLRRKGRIEIETFDRKLTSGFYNGLTLIDLLELYFDEPLLKLSTSRARKDFLKQLEQDFSLLKDWLSYLRRGTHDTKWIHQIIEDSPSAFENTVLYLSEAIRLLPTRPIRLSVFSQIITLDADSFQPSQDLGKLWLHVLAETKRLHAIEPVQLPQTKTEEDELLQEFHLYREDITDAVTVVNLFAETPGAYHPMWETAVHSQSVMTVPLREMIKLSAIYPASSKPQVWIIDNPELFTRILDEVPTIPMICLQENWSCAAWEAFDKLVDKGTQLRFVGDIEPDSISRAETLLMHYPNKARTWRMDVETYLKARDADSTLSKESLLTLNNNHLDELACVKDEMKDRGNPAYLITIIDELVSELKYYYNK